MKYTEEDIKVGSILVWHRPRDNHRFISIVADIKKDLVYFYMRKNSRFSNVQRLQNIAEYSSEKCMGRQAYHLDLIM